MIQQQQKQWRRHIVNINHKQVHEKVGVLYLTSYISNNVYDNSDQDESKNNNKKEYVKSVIDENTNLKINNTSNKDDSSTSSINTYPITDKSPLRGSLNHNARQQNTNHKNTKIINNNSKRRNLTVNKKNNNKSKDPIFNNTLLIGNSSSNESSKVIIKSTYNNQKHIYDISKTSKRNHDENKNQK